MSAIKSKTLAMHGPSHRLKPRAMSRNSALEWRKVRQLGLKRLREFASLISIMTGDSNPKAVHDIRVASRRFQQILDHLYQPPRTRNIRHLRHRIQYSRRSLGAVRDYDVFIASIENRLKRKRVPNRQVLSAIHEYMVKQRIKLMKKVNSKFDKNDVLDIHVQLKNILSATDSREDDGSLSPAITTAPYQGAYGSLTQLWNAFAAQVSKSTRKPQPANIHMVRIGAKRLRYLLEVIYELGDRSAKTPLLQLCRLQQHLGDWHDLEVQEKFLLTIISRRPFPRTEVDDNVIVDMICKMRVDKKGFEQRYLQLVHKSDEWNKLQNWMSYNSPPLA